MKIREQVDVYLHVFQRYQQIGVCDKLQIPPAVLSGINNLIHIL
jgi:hypothetical protein